MKIVFLLSMPRSGSTVLRLHLNQFQGVVALPETHFFVFMAQHRKLEVENPAERAEIADRWVRFHRIRKMPFDKEALRQRITADARTWKDVLLFTLDAYRAQGSPQIAEPLWVEKSPPHIFHQPAIRSMFPEARFIYLVRDPRSVIGSLKTMPWSTTNTYTLARSWRRASQLVASGKGTITVKYEDLVRDPATTFARLGEFLGVPGSYQPLERPKDKVEEGNAFSGNAFKPLSTDMIDKWRNQLSTTDADLSIIQHVCADEMHRMGYDTADTRGDRDFRINLIGQQLRFGLLKVFGNKA
jgi:hypothetical protein